LGFSLGFDLGLWVCFLQPEPKEKAHRLKSVLLSHERTSNY
jgi:hypothetical protein